jgi:hypothetical protein
MISAKHVSIMPQLALYHIRQAKSFCNALENPVRVLILGHIASFRENLTLN